MENFPHEILIEILLRLPVTFLVRFTLVSKSWQALITSPTFMSTHLTRIQNQNSTNNNDFLLCRHYSQNDKKEHYTLHPDNDNFVLKSSEIKFPLKSRVGFHRIVGISNGLVCLCDDMFGTFRKKPIFLWNPSVQKWIDLLSPKIELDWSPSKQFLIGFGYDSERCDFKVVKIVYGQHQQTILDLPTEVEIYSLGTNNWKVVSLGPKYFVADSSLSQVFVDGVVHWLAYDRKGSFRNLIMGFDMKDEIFTEIKLPEVLANKHAAALYLIEHSNCLAVIKYNEFKGYFCLWVMNEYGNVESWKKLFKVELVEGMGRVIGFRKNGHFFAAMSVDELFINDPSTGVLVSFDTESRGIKDLEIFGKINSMYVGKFVESLVLLEGQSGL